MAFSMNTWAFSDLKTKTVSCLRKLEKISYVRKNEYQEMKERLK